MTAPDEPVGSEPGLAGLGGIGGLDLGALLEQAQHMQQQLMASAAQQVVEGQAGGGAVKVRLSGDLRVESVTIDPKAVDPNDVAMLEDLVVAACNDALGRARDVTQQALGGLLGPSD